MKKIKIISMILTVVILITSCNLGMMFTSSADETINIANAANLEALAEKNLKNAGTVTININNDIDASSISSFAPIDASGTIIIFNGNSKLIKNLHITGGGLFSAVGDGSSFENLGMYDCTITDFDGGSGYGFLAGVMHSGTVKNCFADGSISVYGDSASFIGGLVGSFGGTMENCYSMVDIYTNGSYVGGLLGTFVESETVANSVTKCYSTGSIDNDGREYIGGLIGRSATPCITNSYTSVCILNPYADTVKSIGVITGIEADDNVYYDENVSLQRQGDMDPHRCTPSELTSKLNGNGWLSVDGYYPQLAAFVTVSGIPESFARISAISAAVVDVSREGGITTGREFTVVSTPDKYSYAKLTTYDGSSTAVLSDVNQIDWRITGGVDEYYFDPTDLSDFPTNGGATIDGLSGNTYDVNTGKYLFTNTGDIKFTAYSGSFERDIYVHVTTADKNPYIVGGNGTEASPFLINNYNEFDMIRVYCLDDETGKYNYKLDFEAVKTTGYDSQSNVKIFNFTGIDHMPIIGMKGTLDGGTYDENGNCIYETLITNLNITKANEGNIGLFASITNTCTISELHISNAVVKSNKAAADGTPIYEENAGLLAGSMKNSTITNVIATGQVSNAENSGMLAGKAFENVTVDTCITYGIASASKAASGVIADTDNTVNAIHTFSSAVVTDAENLGGFFAIGAGNVEDSVFAGNIGTVKNGTRHGLVDTGTVTNAYYDWQAAGILYSEDSYAVMTSDLTGNLANVNLSDKWGWYESGGTNTGVYTHYPQLKYFAEDQYVKGNSTYSTYKSRTSFMAALSFSFNNNYGPASSVSFESVDLSMAFDHIKTTKQQFVKLPTAYPEDSNGYEIELREDQKYNTGRYKNIAFKVSSGGKQLYSFIPYNANFQGDTRYVMFNVKSINVHYKFAYSDEALKTAYNADMHNKGLTKVTNALANSYNLYLDSTQTESFVTLRFLHVGDTMNFDMTLPVKYNYTVNAYVDSDDSEETVTLAQLDESNISVTESGTLVSISDLDDIYIVFEIEKPILPWGIYRMSSN